MRRFFITVIVAAALGACWAPPPHVSACILSPLAHPTMTVDDLATEHEARVRTSTEAARGELRGAP
jgi:hypothetical protein